jgi:hypothetical protein
MLVSSLLVVGVAHAAATITFTEVGPDVQADLVGTLNTAGLNLAAGPPGFDKAQVLPNSAFALLADSNGDYFDSYTGISGPTSLGPSSTDTYAFSASGNAVGVDMRGTPSLIVPLNFTNGSVSSTATWVLKSFSSLGLTPGTYTYTWAGDSLTIQIGPAPAPVPVLSRSVQMVLALMVIMLVGWNLRHERSFDW